MMTRIFKHTILPLLSAAALVCISCTREKIIEPSVSDGTAWVDIHFGQSDFENVRVETRATLDPIPESRVSNIFVYIFSGEQRIFAHYFDSDSQEASVDDMMQSDIESWYVSQYVGDGSESTHGAVHLRAPLCNGATVFIVANIDSDMVNISPEKMNMIRTRTELMNLVASLNQEITSRNGLFPMAGAYLKNGNELGYVDVTEAGIVPSDDKTKNVSVELCRLDAKVSFNVRVASANEIKITGNGETTTQTLRKFIPESWQVVNLPKGCNLAQHDGEATGSPAGYFSTEPVMFETVGEQEFKYRDSGSGEERTVTSEVNGFSFYMLENRVSAKKDVTAFHLREQKNKDAEGHFDITDGAWTNAPENGTYVVIKGTVNMDVDVASEAKQQQLAAEVTYYVHLGDISSSLNDYSILRNTAYTYTITIKGVNSIEVEVSTSRTSDGSAADPKDVVENEPGAEGMVYIAKESIYTFDAHYGQRVFCFDAKYIDADAVTWYVKTPFGKEGTPDKIGDTEIPSGMDYEWVQFLVNKASGTKAYSYVTDGTLKTAELPNEPFSHNNQAYPGTDDTRLMDVVDFVEYVKTQKRALDAGEANGFRTEFDQEWFDWYNERHPDALVTGPNALIDGKPGPWFRDRIYVTVFVNEFYYDRNPITGEEEPQLWKRFVNQPNRLMHILCDNEKSLDKASSSTGSVVTIRQRSIQTPYNINDDELVSAWGCETEDENAGSYLWYDERESSSNIRDFYPEELNNTSSYNGLYNTARIWGCVSGNSWVGRRWDEFLDYDRPNDYTPEGKEHSILFLKENKACLKYSGIARNRDNNGNGIIDPDELRWYCASIGQLYWLFLGEQGLQEDAKVYPRKYSSAPDEDYPSGHPYAGIRKWKHHIISSTLSNYRTPEVLWCEEAVSVSGYKQYTTEKSSYSIKCVRNLGFEHRTDEYFSTDDAAHRPQDMIEVAKPEGTITSASAYKFDCSRVNHKSKRFRTSIELEPYDEFSEMARLYEGFETGPLISGYNVGASTYEAVKNMLQGGKSPCPEGYRIPNLREVVLIYLMADNKEWWGYNPSGGSSDPNNFRIRTSSYYSMGAFGNRKNEIAETNASGQKVYRTSWNTVSKVFGANANINLNGEKSPWIRCVHDWNPSARE